MKNDELQYIEDALDIAFALMTDEQFDEYQRQRRAIFLKRVCAKRPEKPSLLPCSPASGLDSRLILRRLRLTRTGKGYLVSLRNG
jgi:hypothetical protein